MPATVKDKRAYRATLRKEQSRLTRRRILAAARRLFIERGYSDVSVQDIAREAAVAYQTVFTQFGGKLQLAVELCTSEFPHVGEAVASLRRAGDAGDPEAWLRMLGSFARRLYEPCAEILRFMRDSGEPELTNRLDEIEAGRLQLLARLGGQLERSGRLRTGTSGRTAIDVAWTLTGPATYQQLVLDRGWTPHRFESWLQATLTTLLLEG